MLATFAAELRYACAAATRLLDFLTERNNGARTDCEHEIVASNPVAAPVEVEASRIWIADDNEITASQLSRCLVRQGHSVMVVNNGQAAIEALKKHRSGSCAVRCHYARS
jgi:PleD family two-component response regulator